MCNKEYAFESIQKAYLVAGWFNYIPNKKIKVVQTRILLQQYGHINKMLTNSRSVSFEYVSLLYCPAGSGNVVVMAANETCWDQRQ